MTPFMVALALIAVAAALMVTNGLDRRVRLPVASTYAVVLVSILARASGTGGR